MKLNLMDNGAAAVPKTQNQQPGEAAKIGEESAPVDIVAWAMQKFADRRLVMTTQFGMEGCAVIDMVAQTGKPLKIIYLDTMFFFAETYKLCDRLVERYPHLTFENRGPTITPEEQAAKYGPELWKTDPTRCCQIRKADPMAQVAPEIDVWLTGLRRGQSITRAHIKTVDWDWKFQVLKVNPLAYWSREQVWEYIQKNNVPYNELHEKGYPTLGCTQCTKPVEGASVTDYSREGRWSGMEKTECGLHGDGI